MRQFVMLTAGYNATRARIAPDDISAREAGAFVGG
jgi:hypothetical protein